MIKYGQEEKRKRCRTEFANLAKRIRWSDFKAILITEFGFEMINKRGSLRVFVKEEQRFVVHEPHGKGDPIVSYQDRRKAIRALMALGLLENE